MPIQKYNPNHRRTHPVDMTNRRIGGGAYSMLSQLGFNPQHLKTTKPSAKVEEIKSKLDHDSGLWRSLCYMYSLTPDEYFEIAKFMVNSYEAEYVFEYLRVDKLSANQYYEICKVMAVNGDFCNVDCRKLIQANPEKVKNPLYQIMMTALVKSVFGYYSREATAPRVLRAMRENADCLGPNEKAALFFALWICMKPRYDDVNISCNDLMGIKKHTVDYVKGIIIKEIYKAPDSSFAPRLNFPSNWFDENKGMPQIVNDACMEIFDEIHRAGLERMEKKKSRSH